MAKTALKPMTPEDFFRWQRGQVDLYELVGGFPVKIERACERQHRIVNNMIVSLGTQLRVTPCCPVTENFAIRTRNNVLRRPDLTVTCGEPRDELPNEVQEPKMVIQVLTPSRTGVAWQRKLEEYRRLQRLAYILLVDTRRPQATLLQRTASEWEPIDADGLDATFELPAIGCSLRMRDIYKGLSFEGTEPSSA